MNKIHGFPTPQKDYYKVYVRSNTYNQAPYIEDNLNGVAMQETKFPFVHYVIDDCSTDSEQEVIKAWMDKNCDMENAEFYDNDICTITLVKNKKNPNCTLAAYFLKKNIYGTPIKQELHKLWRDACPYEAVCEGDDYWIDPKKLQKQYDMLEAHPEYSLCHHDYKILSEGKINSRNANVPQTQDLLSIAGNNTVSTLTMFFRNVGEPLIPTDFNFRFPVYQYFWNLRLAEFGKIVYIDEPMAVYRVNQGGIYSMQSLRKKIDMSFGNMQNMIDWFTKGHNRPDVVNVIKERAKRQGKGFLYDAIRSRNFLDGLHVIKWMWRMCYKSKKIACGFRDIPSATKS